MEKIAFNIPVDPATVLGAMAGGWMASKTVGNQNQNSLPNQTVNKLNSQGYLEQTKNFAKNMDVVFGPFSVVYVLKDGSRLIQVDSLDYDDMTDDMRAASEAKNKDYFKSLMMNKIRLEVSMAEKIFAKRLLQQQAALNNNFGVEPVQGGFAKQAEELSRMMQKKIASDFMYSMTEDMSPYIVECKLGNSVEEIHKFASIFSHINGVLNPTSSDGLTLLSNKLSNPNYLDGHLQVKMLPDRVLFIADNIVVDQFNVMDMNEKDYEAFSNHNLNYFKAALREELKIQASIPSNDELLKQAAVIPALSDLFTRADIHPMVYHAMLIRKFGPDFGVFDPEVIIKELEEHYNLSEPMHEIAMNKIVVIQGINNDDNIYFENIHGFEKMVRCLAGLPIMFDERENDFTTKDLVFALKVAQDATHFDDIYDNLSEGVLDYLSNYLFESNDPLLYPVIEMETEGILYDHISLEACALSADRVSGGDETIFLDCSNEYDFARKHVMDFCNLIRESGAIEAVAPAIIESMKGKIAVDLPTNYLGDLIEIIVQEVKDNIGVDIYLNHMSKVLESQMTILEV